MSASDKENRLSLPYDNRLDFEEIAENQKGDGPLARLGKSTAVHQQLLVVWSQAGKRPVYIWGAGIAGFRACRFFGQLNFPLTGFLDSDPSKHGHKIMSLPIYSPEKLCAAAPGSRPFVLVCSMHHIQITQYLIASAFREGEDFVNFSIDPYQLPPSLDLRVLRSPRLDTSNLICDLDRQERDLRGLESIRSRLQGPVFIWGAGRRGCQIADTCRQITLSFSGFIDSDPDKQGRIVMDWPVYPPEELHTQKSAGARPFVLVDSKHYQSIARHLETLGFHDQIDYLILS